MDLELANADYETVKEHYTYVCTQPVQEYYVIPRPQASNEGPVTVDQDDKKSNNRRRVFDSHLIQQNSYHSRIQCRIVLAAVVVLVSFCALGLSIGAFLNGVKHGNELKRLSTQFKRTAAQYNVLAELNSSASSSIADPNNCEECVSRTDLDIYCMSTSQELNSLQSLYHELNHTVHEVWGTRYMYQNLSMNYTMQQKIASDTVDLSTGCISIISVCVINHNNAGTPPTSLTCETPEHLLEAAGMRNVNIFCSIDNSAGEINPVTATLNIYNGEVSCLCSLIALTTSVASIECRMTIQRCPKSVMFNINYTRSQHT